MTDQERDLITRFIERVAGGQSQGQPQGQPLPPLDPDANRLIAELFGRYPEAAYRITQMAMVEEHALVEAQNRISRLQWELQQARQAQAAPPPPQGSPWGTAAPPPPQQPHGFLSGLFGGGGTARPAAPPPQYAPPPPQYAPPAPQYPQGYSPGMFQQQGPGFLGSAVRTAAGVAGGMLAADALMNLFSGSRGGFGGGGFGGGGPAEVVEYVPVEANPWGAPQADPGAPPEPSQVDQAAWTPAPDQGQDQGFQDPSADPGIDPGADQGGGWDQPSDDGGGWGDDDIQNI